MAVLDPQAEALLASFAARGNPPLEESTPAVARANRRALVPLSTIEVHEIRDVSADGVPARLYRPSPEDGLGLLVYFHGGGWVTGDLETHDGTCRRLAVASGHAVLSVDYRLAPEHRYPAAVEDALAVVAWAHANATGLGCDQGRLAVGGDSAGGTLAAVVAQRNHVPLRFLLLVYPVVDARCETTSYEEFADGPFLTRAGMTWFFDHYLGEDAGFRDEPDVSPLLADDARLAASPPTLVLTVGADVLRDEGEAYAARLAALGVPTEHRRYEGMFHGFFAMPDLLDAGAEAVAFAGDRLERALST
jgi:acetyl esterase